jgi:hypothetical protein
MVSVVHGQVWSWGAEREGDGGGIDDGVLAAHEFVYGCVGYEAGE